MASTKLHVSKQGIVCYQSKLLPRKQAESFAGMVRANHNFGLAWLEHWKATDPRRFVCYLPRSAKKQYELRVRYQQGIADKAREQLEAGEYTIEDDGWGGFLVTKVADGTCHEVNQWSCDCLRHIGSLCKAKIKCKHRLMAEGI